MRDEEEKVPTAGTFYKKHNQEQLNSVWYIFIYSLIFICYHCTLVDPYKAIFKCTALYRLNIQSKNPTSVIPRTGKARRRLQLLSCMQERSVGVIGVCLFVVALQLCHLGQQRRVDHLGHVTGGLGLLNNPHDLVHGLRRLGGIRVLVVGLLPLRDLPRQVLQEPRVMLYLRDRDPL